MSNQKTPLTLVRDIRAHLMKLVANKEHFKAVQFHNGGIKKRYDNHWEYIRPYFELIDQFELENFDVDLFEKLKNESKVSLITSSPMSIDKGSFTTPPRMNFHNELYKVIMKYVHKVELEKIITAQKIERQSPNTLQSQCIELSNTYDPKNNRVRCQSCQSIANNQPFSVMYAPELPLTQCTRRRCHCYYHEIGLNDKMDYLRRKYYGILQSILPDFSKKLS